MYFQNHIWSLNETNIQANQHFKAKILAQKGSHQVYSNISKSLDWFTINYVMDAINRFEHAFYIFQSEWKHNGYISLCRPKTCMAMQKQSMDDIFYLCKEFFSLFKKSIVGGISQANCHLLILNGHGSHVTLKTIEQAQVFRLYMVTLHSHTSMPFNL